MPDPVKQPLLQRLHGNIYTALVLRFGIVMLLFSLCRVGFYLFNRDFFAGLKFADLLYILWGGIRFDLSALLYINALYIVLQILPIKQRFSIGYQNFCKYLFFVTNSIGLAANVIDFVYFRFTLRRTTADVFKQFENEENLPMLFGRFLIDYWYALLVFVALVVLMVVLYNRVRMWGPQVTSAWRYWAGGVVVFFGIVYVAIGGIRGGFRHSTRPITLSNAGEYITNPRDVDIVLNTPFALIRTAGRTQLQPRTYFPEDSVDRIYTPIHYPIPSEPFRKKNVVVIILESFSKEFIGAFNREKKNGAYEGYTPFLDSLIGHSKTFSYSFANGRKSIDGLPSVISSIPSLGVPYFLSPYSGNQVNSLQSLLKTKGYHTSFFHGAPNGSMGFQAFANLAGIDHYYGMSEYGNSDDYDGMWGIWDEPFFSFFADKLNSFQEPFASTIFSVSSHHPFVVPEAYENKFRRGDLVIHPCIQYTDMALKNFFTKAAAMPWYKNTLFVITADHTSSEIEFDETRTPWGFYSVPIIFFSPEQDIHGIDSDVVQQADIMPSVLGYLHYDAPFGAFGRNVFSKDEEPFAVNFHNNAYQLFENEFVLIFDGEKTKGLYRYRTDKLMKDNLMDKDKDAVLRMEKRIRAIIQQYSNRMIANRLIPEAQAPIVTADSN